MSEIHSSKIEEQEKAKEKLEQRKAKNREKSKRWQESNLEKGLCRCGKLKEDPNVQRCNKCRDKHRESEKRRNEIKPRVRVYTEEQKKEIVQRSRRCQRNNVAKGLCIRCRAVREDQNNQQCSKCRELRRKSNLENDHGITVEEYNQMLAKQNGVCKICGEEEKAKRKQLHVDHDHETGKIRGLLCKTCNMGIGSFQDSPELLQRAINYIQENKG